MFKDEKILAFIKKMVTEQLDVDESEITPNAWFVADLGADSLDLVEFVMKVEDEYNLEIPDEEAVKIISVRDAIAYIEART